MFEMKNSTFEVSANGTTKTAPLQVIYKRIIFYGGAKNDNDVFKRAAINVNNDYSSTDKVKDEDFILIETAKTIVEKINSETDNIIQSIDIFSHGGRDALYFSHSEFWGSNNLYKNQIYESEHANYWWNDSKILDDIDYNAFTNTAKIEIHGCNTGSYDEGMDSPFAEVLSKHLHNAGKTKAVVIAHATKANPNMHKTLKGDDYRHSLRRIFHKGKELFTTRKEGRITASEINKHLK